MKEKAQIISFSLLNNVHLLFKYTKKGIERRFAWEHDQYIQFKLLHKERPGHTLEHIQTKNKQVYMSVIAG